ncbi:ribosomal protein L32E [Caldisphaera lagunensis DSM 15908]|uniref:Large ribosomal subunit protein eL32 n=1 Tax=Caldisphaera lagunensis (strain DSM 15908 / JCM 11604 / ANMR 0165 / IC-154) TaxID=1056495 RepID=L0ACM3_CALLD|nr:50S ribosomal protein L32e [Caldisphaera lagunensis]AFZ70897.1 ribosomal protein L32E [Caldisphaera lagunensis DSM 15908]
MSSEQIVKDILKQKRKIRESVSEKRRVHFMRYLSWRFKRLGDSWRKPKGIDAKMRLQRKGYPPIVKVGYKNKNSIRGLHPSGLIPVVISNKKELELLSPRAHIIYIDSSVGLKKRVELLKVAKEKGFKVANGGIYGL